MTGRALSVVHGPGPNRLARTGATPRLRPGERPVAVDPALTRSEVRALRAHARSHGLGVDAYVSVFLEYESVCALAGRVRVAALADARRLREPVDAIAAAELQGWHRLVTGRAEPAGDDLPAVFIPLRLATALSPSDRIEVVRQAIEADSIEMSRAVELEAAATVRGLVMQTWVLSQLAGASGGPAAATL